MLALAADQELEGLSDEQVLEYGTELDRIAVTGDGKDFMPLTRAWSASGREHAGVLLIWSIPLDDYRKLTSAINAALVARTAQEWRGLTTAVRPQPAGYALGVDVRNVAEAIEELEGPSYK